MKNKDQITKAIILAGGYSRRIKLKVPKQMVKISNKPLLAHTLDVFERCKAIDSIILVSSRNLIHQCRNLLKIYGYKKIEQLIIGGRTRQQSVFNALRRVKDCDYVIIHDGVRPFVSQKIILKTLKAAKRYNAATSAVQTTDTTAKTRKSFVGTFLCRDKLINIQTPQAFRFNLIMQAHKDARLRKRLDCSDDAQLVAKSKNKVRIIEGDYKNLKVTTPLDLYLAKALLQNKK